MRRLEEQKERTRRLEVQKQAQERERKLREQRQAVVAMEEERRVRRAPELALEVAASLGVAVAGTVFTKRNLFTETGGHYVRLGSVGVVEQKHHLCGEARQGDAHSLA